ncbi:MAG: uroporphyrinogen decarboxylase family protein [Spirochaetia bacterium]
MKRNEQRSRVLQALHRENEDYIPFDFILCPSLYEQFKTKTGETDYREFYDIPVRFIEAPQTGNRNKFFGYFKEDPGKLTIDNFGVGSKPGSLAHFSAMVHPMESMQKLSEFKEYPYPVPEDWDWSAFETNSARLKENGRVVAAGLAMTIFEIAWYMRGMDRFMMDMMTEPELAEYHMDRITEIRCRSAAEYAGRGADILFLGDDVATQRGMMMSPEMWRRFLKPRLREVIRCAKKINPEIMIDYHSDGDASEIVGELIEIGVDILNPVQPECMDPGELKRLYGTELTFHGTIGTQTTMPFGTPDEVRWVCKKMMETVGAGGGLLLAPTHVLEPEVPWINIEAMIETIRERNGK